MEPSLKPAFLTADDYKAQYNLAELQNLIVNRLGIEVVNGILLGERTSWVPQQAFF